MRYAILSVSDKTGIVDLARALVDRDYVVISTGGTARVLTTAAVPLRGVSEITGVPEMMDGRVKTLHPNIHGGILARRDHPADLEAAARQGIGLIDLVVVNLYPFARAAATPDLPVADLLEEIDIGGPSLVRAAAKNFRDVLVVIDPADYGTVIAEVDRPGGPSLAFRLDLARKAFAHTADYDGVIAGTLSELTLAEDGIVARVQPGAGPFPAALHVDLRKRRDLRYGENPHQRAAWYAIDAGPAARGAGLQPAPADFPPARGIQLQPDFSDVQILQGKELSYTNLLDLDAAARMVSEFDGPVAVVVKHTNPCGAATGASLAEAYVRARDADALAAYGGIVGLNRPIDVVTAQAIASTFIEAVIAPGVDDEARRILASKKNMRVVVADLAGLSRSGGATWDLRSIFCGMLVQQRDRVRELAAPWPPPPASGVRVVTARQPTDPEWMALAFAWRIAAHVKSNAVIFTDAEKTLAIGAGQVSRVDAVQVAVTKVGMRTDGVGASAGRPLAGSVAASDAFFPFRDGLDRVAAAGATAVIQPGGSVRDQEVIAAADEHGLAMVFTGMRHFRH